MVAGSKARTVDCEEVWEKSKIHQKHSVNTATYVSGIILVWGYFSSARNEVLSKLVKLKREG